MPMKPTLPNMVRARSPWSRKAAAISLAITKVQA